MTVEIRIGIQHSPRELVFESESDASAVLEKLQTAITDGTTVTLEDAKGKTLLIPGAKVAYAEVSGQEPRRVGFFG